MASGWTYLAAIVIGASLLGGAYQTGHNAAWRKAEVDTLRAERDAARADLAAQKAAADRANALAGEIAIGSAADQAKLKELTDELARSGDRCRIGDAARRMRLVR